jgi:hypothetical protein
LNQKKRKANLIFILVVLLFFETDGQESKGCSYLKISENQRFLTNIDDQPFFWLGDTGWLLFSKLTREEAEKYLDNRAEKGFNVIQVMVLHELKVTNVYGDSALTCQDVSRPAVTSRQFF